MSSHQIEGHLKADGRGESIWDRFAAAEGNIADGSDAEVACDHYLRWPEDIELMKQLGVGSYRLSVSWSRVLPEGTGKVNAPGLDFYDRLVDGLVAAGIKPCVTLNHWDFPQALQDRGGWSDRDVAEAFVEYTQAVAGRIGDRVTHWVTQNEPWCITTLGYEQANHAPGLRDSRRALHVAHHLLLSHGWAVRALRELSPESEVGIVLNLTPGEPATDAAGDREAAHWFDGFFNRWYLDPLFRGEYPADAVRDRIAEGDLDPGMPFVRDGDMEVIRTPTDYLGVNYYSRAVMRTNEKGKRVGVPPHPDGLTDMGWEVYPEGLYDLLLRLKREYDPPRIYITENGAAFSDTPDGSGRVSDPRRVRYLHDHLDSVHRAIADGVPVAGYYAWALLDNFEWAHGYEKRFGLYWVDYETQQRIPKDSAFWYRDVIAAGALQDATRQPPEEVSS